MSNTAVLDENGIATVAGDITVYHYDEETREYTSSSVEYLALGWVLRHIRADAPPEAISGYVVCRTATLNGGSMCLITAARRYTARRTVTLF
ncbi:hypothetical protein ECZU08_55350 [Escherichia coli]|nr:hypothetical protein ECZU08_55350 [Escherichia coli]